MASLRKESDRGRTGWRLQFRHEGVRRSLWLGDIAKRSADTILSNINELVESSAMNTTAKREAIEWANGLKDERIFASLVKWGLVSPRVAVDAKSRFCNHFFTSYVDKRTGWSPITTANYKQANRWFKKRFGDDRLLASITPADFESWHLWMIESGLAKASANKHAKRIRTLFEQAIKSRLIHDNPGKGYKLGGEVNRDRDHYVTRAEATAILEQCDTEWAMIFGLCRFAGFRCPTEVVALKWTDVQWAEERLQIDSKKTGLRFCPIFPELRPLLDAGWELAGKDAVYVISRNRNTESNLRTQLGRIIEKAGIVPWQKPFVNLRASCRTDLEERFPSHVIDSWMGHSTKVAKAHYRQP